MPEGCCLSPILFAVFISDLDNYAEEKGIKIGEEVGVEVKIWYMAYADDLVILGDTDESMRKSIKSLESFSKTISLVVNVKKTKVLIFGRGRQADLGLASYGCGTSFA